MCVDGVGETGLKPVSTGLDRLMLKMPNPGCDHCDVGVVADVDGFLVAFGASWVDDGYDSGGGC